MPELPEVESTVRALRNTLLGKTFLSSLFRCKHLRYPIPITLILRQLPQAVVTQVQRRAKYILIQTSASGSLIFHLGMSGSLRVVNTSIEPLRHDHVDLVFTDSTVLRLNDPRRFGALLWQDNDQPLPLLQHLGVEPLSPAFSTPYVVKRAAISSVSTKTFLMNQSVVVGVGNIYANEALFRSQIHPCTPVNLLSHADIRRLVHATKATLRSAIKQGGTTIRDFVNPSGIPGYFVQALSVYGKQGQPCCRCGSRLRHAKLAQRTTVWCPQCQPEHVALGQ